nr:MAG TPA: hypothetical protein [Caudoviricetes sp.]
MLIIILVLILHRKDIVRFLITQVFYLFFLHLFCCICNKSI